MSTAAVEGVGTDIVEIERIKVAVERHGDRFLDRLFTASEQAYCGRYKDPSAHYAGRFAAKEAILKALGTGLSNGISWKEIEILNDKQGKPEVLLSAKLRAMVGLGRILISISHCHAYATATAIVVN